MHVALKDFQAEQFIDCRIDHYQTPAEVHVSVFAKKVDQEHSVVNINSGEVLPDCVSTCRKKRLNFSQISFDLYLPGSKRFRKTVQLFGPIDADASSYKYYGTKVDVYLCFILCSATYATSQGRISPSQTRYEIVGGAREDRACCTGESHIRSGRSDWYHRIKGVSTR